MGRESWRVLSRTSKSLRLKKGEESASQFIYCSPDLSEEFLLSDFFSSLLPSFIVKHSEEGLICWFSGGWELWEGGPFW